MIWHARDGYRVKLVHRGRHWVYGPYTLRRDAEAVERRLKAKFASETADRKEPA